jgi:hypothetical protein
MRQNWSVISKRAARDSLFKTPEWAALDGTREKIGEMAGRYFGWWKSAVLEAKPDNYVDSLGFAPLMPWLLVPLVLAGVWWGWKKYPLVVPLCVLICLVLPLTTVVSINGNSRRPFGMLPFLLLLASIGAVEIALLWPRLLARGRAGTKLRLQPLARTVSAAVVGVWLAAVVAGESRLYWGLQPVMGEQKFVYGRDLTEFALWARSLPPDSYVFFACPRWAIGYEVNLWLAPDLRGEDRSREFAPPETRDDLLATDVSQGRPVWVMLGDYTSTLLPQLQARYPGGSVYDPPGDETPSFIAYFPPT